MSLRERKKVQARLDILEAATELITAKGYDETTMRDVADRAGLSYQTLYNYFPNKALIVEALLTQDSERITERMARVFAEPSAGLLDLFNKAARVLFEAIAHRDRQLWREVIALSIKLAPAVYHINAPYYEDARARIAGALTGAQDRGSLDPYVDVDLMARTIFGILDLAFLMYIMDPTLSRVAIVETVRSQLALLITPYLRVE